MDLPSTMMFQINKPVERDAPFHADVLIPSGTTFEPPITWQIYPSSIDRANQVLEEAIQKAIWSHHKDLRIDNSKSTELLENLVEAGRTAFEEIVEDDQTRSEIASKLRELSDGSTITIMFDRQQPVFTPWEFLAYDYDSAGPSYHNFWGYRHVICRQTLSGYSNFGRFNPVLQPRLALLASEGLSYVDDVKRPYLKELASQNRIKYTDFADQVDKVAANAKRRQRRFSTLLNGRDLRIANFACCIIPVDNTCGPFRILLHHDMKLGLDEIRQHLSLYENKLVILFNLRFKEGTKETSPENVRFALYGSHYWVDAFLELGAAGVIATDCGIPDLFAATFARGMYQYLIEGSKIGGALLKTRQDMLEGYRNPLGLAYTLYVHPDKQLFEPRGDERVKKPVTVIGGEVSVSPSDSLWNAIVGGIPYHIDEGVHRDIINSLQTAGLDALFAGIVDYKEKLWAVLCRPQDDTAYSYASNLWMDLWAQEEGLPPFNMVRLLAQKEYSGDLYKGYRDHVVHSLLVYLLGLHLYYSNRRVQEAMTRIGEQSEFLKVWKIAALFHDVGYYLSVKDSRAELRNLLLGQLQDFVENPLQAYGAVHGEFSLAGADEKEIRRRAVGRPVWELGAVSDLRKPLGLADGHILDSLDDLVRGADLADHGEGRYCYRYDKYAQDTDTDTHPRCDDHGMVSAMILLGQHAYFHRYTVVTCKPEILEKVPGLSPEACAWLPKLPKRIEQYTDSVRQAAAAIALHNVHVTGWTEQDPDWSKARGEPYFLTLDRYKLSLSETPLAWLLALTDVLQCWDRPSRTDAPLALEDCTMKHQEIRIMASSSEKIAVTFATDANRKAAASRFNKLVDEMGKYMQDLDLLEQG